MRRRKANRGHFPFKIILFSLLFIIIIGVGYSYFNLSLNISGNVTGKNNNLGYIITPDSSPYLKVNVSLTNKWTENNTYHYQYTFIITNIGNELLDNFQITTIFNSNIKSVTVWDFDYTSSGKTLDINNTKYSLEPGQSINVNFTFVSSSNLKIVSIKLSTITNSNEVGLDKFNVSFSITSGWGNYIYQYNVTVTNKTGSKITSWQIDINMPVGTSYISGWNGIFSTNNNVLTIKNTDYNGKLNNNASTTFGMQIQTNIINFIPTVTKILVR